MLVYLEIQKYLRCQDGNQSHALGLGDQSESDGHVGITSKGKLNILARLVFGALPRETIPPSQLLV